MGWNPVDDILDTGRDLLEGTLDLGEKALEWQADLYTGGAYSSYKAQRAAMKAQKEQQRKQQELIDAQQRQALEQRKNQINQMRAQIGAGGVLYKKNINKRC